MIGRLRPRTVWLFAVVTLAVALAVTKLVPHLAGPISPKLMAAVYFAVFGAGATAATVLTRAGALHAIGAFSLGSAGLGGFYYATIANQGGVAAAGVGLVFAVAFTVDTLAAGIAGTLFGLKLRRARGFAIAR